MFMLERRLSTVEIFMAVGIRGENWTGHVYVLTFSLITRAKQHLPQECFLQHRGDGHPEPTYEARLLFFILFYFLQILLRHICPNPPISADQ